MPPFGPPDYIEAENEAVGQRACCIVATAVALWVESCNSMSSYLRIRDNFRACFIVLTMKNFVVHETFLRTLHVLDAFIIITFNASPRHSFIAGIKNLFC